MARMTDEQFEQAKAKAKDLHAFLHKYGDDGDEWSGVWAELENLVGPRGSLTIDSSRTKDQTNAA